MANSQRKKSRKNKCSTCGRLARDHLGPSGPKCDWEMSDEDLDSSAHSVKGLTDTSGANTSALNELANQMGKLTVHLQKIDTDLQNVKTDVQNVKAGPSDAGGSLHRTRASDYMATGGVLAGQPEAHVCLPSGAKVSPRTIAHAKHGEYVNLADFAPCLEPSLVTETSIVDGELVFKPKRSVKSIDSFLLWSMSWRTYEELLVCDNPSLYPSMCTYRIFIQTCAAKYWWPAVYSYDVRNRSKHAMDRSFNFDSIDHNIYVTTMDSTTVRQNVRNCARCKSIWHVIKDCPFSEDGSVAASPRQATTSARPQANAARIVRSPDVGNQICFNWNAGRCNVNPCPRRHVCETCGGPDPKPRCSTCNPGARRSPTTASLGANFTQPSFIQQSNNPPPSGRMG
jgi:hypothetical protein